MSVPFEFLDDRLRWVLEKLEDATNELDTERRIQERLAWALYRLVAVVPKELPTHLQSQFEQIKEAILRIQWRGGDPVLVALPDADCEALAVAIVDLRDAVRGPLG